MQKNIYVEINQMNFTLRKFLVHLKTLSFKLVFSRQSMSHATKWRCRACSYDNWPANIRCTICRAPRPSPRIEDEMYRLQVTEAIGLGEANSTRQDDSTEFSHEQVSLLLKYSY